MRYCKTLTAWCIFANKIHLIQNKRCWLGVDSSKADFFQPKSCHLAHRQFMQLFQKGRKKGETKNNYPRIKLLVHQPTQTLISKEKHAILWWHSLFFVLINLHRSGASLPKTFQTSFQLSLGNSTAGSPFFSQGPLNQKGTIPLDSSAAHLSDLLTPSLNLTNNLPLPSPPAHFRRSGGKKSFRAFSLNI